MQTLIDLLAWKPGQETQLDPAQIPVLGFVIENQMSKIEALKAGVVPLSGDLDVITHAQVHNWIYVNVPGAQTTFHDWVAKHLVAHAITLLLAKRLRSDTDPEAEAEHSLILRAWEVQLGSHELGDRSTGQDVDLECLREFESRIFDATEEAGKAGYYQWGLDAGDHQDVWDPYDGVPEDLRTWHPEDDEELLEVNLQCRHRNGTC